MIRRRTSLSSALLCVVAAAATGCLSSGPPAPPVRWFDPSPQSVGARDGDGLRLLVRAPLWLGDGIAVRVDGRELAFDEQHRWVAPPAELLERALRDRGVGVMKSSWPMIVELERFEVDRTGLDVGGAPRARLRAVVRRGRSDAVVVDVDEPAAADSVEAQCDAVATAMPRFVEAVIAAVRELGEADGDGAAGGDDGR